MEKHLLIPEERKAVLIGVRGSTRKKIAYETRTKIVVEKESNDVVISGEAMECLAAENIIRAIGRGFSPYKALKLLDEEYLFHVIDLPKEEKVLKRVRSRIIGTRGKCRMRIEMLTKTNISVFGKTVAILGKYEDVGVAEQAIQKLIKGFTHKAVYEFLEKKQVDEW